MFHSEEHDLRLLCLLKDTLRFALVRDWW